MYNDGIIGILVHLIVEATLLPVEPKLNRTVPRCHMDFSYFPLTIILWSNDCDFNYYLYFYADIKYQIHVCHVNLKQNHQAIVVLQSIPGKLRNAKINMALAKLYQQGGMERSAITSYKEVLRVWSHVEVTDGGGLT